MSLMSSTTNPIRRNPGFQVMHWHEDLQFIYVLDGIIEVRTLDDVVRIQAGEAIFINKNVVHYRKTAWKTVTITVLFSQHISLNFMLEVLPKIFVDSVTANEQLSLFHFHACCRLA